MAERNKKDFREELKQVADHLREPFKMRMAVAGICLVVMFFGISEPLHGRIKKEKRDLTELKNKTKIAQEVELLQSHLENVEPRIFRGKSNDVIVTHLIDLTRKHPVDLMRIAAEAPSRQGPMQSVRVSLDLIGDHADLLSLLHSFESDQRLMRIESISITPPERNRTKPTMALSIRLLKDKP